MKTETVKKNGAADTAPPVDRSLAAEASSAHSRINIPLNIDNWKALSATTTEELLWFHQFLLDNNMSLREANQALGYTGTTTAYRVLKGIYEGSWDNVVSRIRSFRKIEEQRSSVQKSEFVPNSISNLIGNALDYALTVGKITIIVGESRSGKTIGARAWCQANNHGRAVFVTAPVVGGISSLVRRVAERCGVNRNKSVNDIADSLYRSFNKNRILLVDEAHRLLPNEYRSVSPQKIEFLRDLHDETGCALALLVTARFTNALRKGVYQYEQLIGRVGQPIVIPAKIKRSDIVPIVRQFVKNPTTSLLEEMERIANSPGRLGIMVEILKFSSRIASKAKQSVNEEHVRKAIAIRAQMSGGLEAK